jgi:hypothetical protein
MLNTASTTFFVANAAGVGGQSTATVQKPLLLYKTTSAPFVATRREESPSRRIRWLPRVKG